MVLRALFITETTLIWYCYHSVMMLRPLQYGVTTILTLSSPNYQYDTTTTQVFKIKYRNLNTTNVRALFFVGPPHPIFSIYITLYQSIITWCLLFQFFFQHHTNVPTEIFYNFSTEEQIVFQSLKNCSSRSIYIYFFLYSFYSILSVVPKRLGGAACCSLAFYSSVNNGLYIYNILITKSLKINIVLLFLIWY